MRWFRSSIRAAIGLLNRLGADVVVAAGEGCCGALNHHLGLEGSARRSARANVAAWDKVRAAGGLDRIVSTASGCGAVVKDYAHLLAGDAGEGTAAQPGFEGRPGQGGATLMREHRQRG